MKFIAIVLLLIITFISCSQKDESNPVNNEVGAKGFIRGNVNSISWYSNQITTYKSGNTRIIKGTQPITNDPKFTSTVLEFRIGVNQTGVFGIGENEPGYQYSIKAYYSLISQSGVEDENYKAYYENISLMTINRISNSDLDANFNFVGKTDDSTKTVVISSGVIQIDY